MGAATRLALRAASKRRARAPAGSPVRCAQVGTELATAFATPYGMVPDGHAGWSRAY